jgi:hypothetical protein
MERKKEPKSSITAVFYIYEVYYMAFKSEMRVIDEAHHPKIPQIHKHTTQHRLELPHIIPANTLPQKHTVMIVLGHTHIASHAVPCAASPSALGISRSSRVFGWFRCGIRRRGRGSTGRWKVDSKGSRRGGRCRGGVGIMGSG